MSALLLALLLAQADPHAHHGPSVEEATHELGAPLAHRETDRLASGTAWQSVAPHHGWHTGRGSFRFMLHGLLFGGYDWQAAPRGGRALVGLGWLMAMARRDGETNALVFRAMLSPEPWTVRGGGYPLLGQTGETWQGQPLHDRQHPHDLVMELAALYTQQLTGWLAVQGYAAVAGEPALGPVAFPHRASALADPLAPLGHHWMDSTHVTFGVLTLGLLTSRVKLEGSWFNGHEPDERRYDLDLHRPNAWSARLSLAPVEELMGQISFARLPGGGHHGGGAGHDEVMYRGTASLTHHASFAGAGRAASLLAFGWNRMHETTLAALAESTVDLDGDNVVFTRLEYVQKSGQELVVPAPLDAVTHEIMSVTFGYLRNFGPFASLLPGVGVRASGTYVPAELGPIYGGRRFPLGAMVYVRLLPAAWQEK